MLEKTPRVPSTDDTLTPLGATGFVVGIAGLIGWVWLDDWRYAATGVLAGLGLMVLSAVVKAHRKLKDITDR